MVKKIIKIPINFIRKASSNSISFVYNKQKKLAKIISPSNIRIVTAKIYQKGRKFFLKIVFVITVVTSLVIEKEKIIQSYSIFPTEAPI
jgi:hypothetical protein